MCDKKKRLRNRDPRRAIFRLARQLDPEPGHCFQVRKNAERLFAGLGEALGLAPGDWPLLEAAALLHDIGHRRGFAGHHKHSRDMILARRWPGLGVRTRRIVACVARYHRKAEPEPGHAQFRDLSAPDQLLVTRLAAILRIADGLDRAHRASVRGIRVEADAEGVTLHIDQRWAEPVDLAGGARKAGLLEAAFGRAVRIVADAAPRGNPL